MSRIRKYLFQCYPVEGNVWRIIIPISLFIGLFIIVFQPFGLSDLESDYKFLILTGFGLVTFIILILNLILIPSLLPGIFKEEKWTVLKELFFLLWILFTVGLGNLLYSSWTMEFRLTISNILIFQSYTLAIGIIPITFLTLFKQNYLKRKNMASAGQLSSVLDKRNSENNEALLIRIASDNEKDGLSVNVHDLLFIKSDGNYITTGYLKNGKLNRVLLRNTMKYAVDLMVPFPFIFQCHRSWLINLHKITGVSGNSQGLRIVIEGFEEDIPVARNKTSELRRRITGNAPDEP